ncbi:MAG TPA: ribose 5-phosphate isomerase B [Myxococcaceae bacterium]|nr:ribose 5-phosphate isomerase B [Myxococcaceae bacterium]
MATPAVTVLLASDHAGVRLKAALVAHLAARGVAHEDLGPTTTDRVDYPDFALRVSERVAAVPDCVGVLVCGTGIGMSMAANKVAGIRAALCSTEFEARSTRAHNDANVLCLGERVVGEGVAASILDAFLETAFEGGRHTARVEKLHAADRARHAERSR